MNPNLSFADDKLERNNELKTNLDARGYEAAMNYVIDPGFGEAGWDKWLENAKALGVDELVANYDEAQAVFDSK